jgi:hypothetical protein
MIFDRWYNSIEVGVVTYSASRGSVCESCRPAESQLASSLIQSSEQIVDVQAVMRAVNMRTVVLWPLRPEYSSGCIPATVIPGFPCRYSQVLEPEV